MIYVSCGWQVQCVVCARTETSFKPLNPRANLTGPPGLDANTFPGWTFDWGSYGRHRVFCPEHKDVLDEWRKQMQAWKDERKRIGKITFVQAFIDRVQKRDRMKEWEADNPMPNFPFPVDI